MTEALDLRTSTAHAEPPEPFDGMRVSEADYWAHYYEWPDVSYEWNNGILEEKGVSDLDTSVLFQWFIRLLSCYLDTRPIGMSVGLEMAFRLPLAEKTVIRRPDTGVILKSNPVQPAGRDRSYRGVFDLCIEGLSDSSKAKKERDTKVKYAEYALGGVREYYILHHQSSECAFYGLTDQGLYAPLHETSEGLIRSGVLPGFQWRLSDLWHRPAFETLVDDPVYEGFVLPALRQARLEARQEWQRAEQQGQRAEQEHQRAERERQRAEQALEQAERLASRLRALGVDPGA